MTQFTEQNTEGFTAEELSTLNAAYDALIGELDRRGMEPSNLCDILNNLWFTGMTSEELVAAYRAR